MATKVIMPKFGMTMDDGIIVRWFKHEGDPVEKGELLVEVTTDKVNMEIESPASGILRNVTAQPGDVIPVTQVIAYIAEPGEAIPIPKGLSVSEPTAATGEAIQFQAPIERAAEKVSATSEPVGAIAATPVARRMAKELNIDLALVQGSGPRGRITEADVRAAAARLKAPSEETFGLGLPASAIPAAPATRIPLTGRRKIIAERMSKSASEAPHIRLTVEVDMSAAERERGTFSYTAFLAWHVCQVLRRHPLVNATLQAQEIVLNPDIHLGIAVDTPEGLIVPVIKDADKKSLAALDSIIRDLSQRARDGKLTLEQVTGGTFTISNLGMFGIEEFHAIINPPQSAILAVGAIVKRPIAVGDLIGLRPMMKLTLSADHRVLDGAAAARFLQDLKAGLETKQHDPRIYTNLRE